MENYHVDIVMCIDKTGNMQHIVDELELNLHELWVQMVDFLKDEGKGVGKLRIKVIAFGDCRHDRDPMIVTDFYTMPQQETQLQEFFKHLKAYGGGDRPEDALLALALALQSDWTREGPDRRHIVMMFSDAPAHPLEDYDLYMQDGPLGVPHSKDIPGKLTQLEQQWNGTARTKAGTYDAKAGRMVLFVPRCAPWNEIERWRRTVPIHVLGDNGLWDVNCMKILQGFLDCF